MTTTVAEVGVSGNATLIQASNSSRASVRFINIGNKDVFIGSDNSVTTANGFPVLPSETYIETKYTGDIYGIVATATENVRVWEEV